jgi:hypothetical protein
VITVLFGSARCGVKEKHPGRIEMLAIRYLSMRHETEKLAVLRVANLVVDSHAFQSIVADIVVLSIGPFRQR